MNSPSTIYRNESCRALAEKVANSNPASTLDITFHIEQVLKRRDHATVNQVLQSIADQEPFCLFSDKNHYCIIIPCNLVVACYVDDEQITLEVSKDAKQFQNRVKILFVVYEHFRTLNRLVESGRYGDGALPAHTERNGMCIGTQHEE